MSDSTYPPAAGDAANPMTSISVARQAALTSAGKFWYVLMCVALGAGYFAKIPAKKAFEDSGAVQMTSWERIWYILMCVAFGAGYFAKLPTAKALSELPRDPASQQ